MSLIIASPANCLAGSLVLIMANCSITFRYFGKMSGLHGLGLVHQSASGTEVPELGDALMSISTLLVILLLIFLLGGFSGRFGGYGYGYGHGGVGVIGVILIILVVLMLLGRI